MMPDPEVIRALYGGAVQRQEVDAATAVVLRELRRHRAAIDHAIATLEGVRPNRGSAKTLPVVVPVENNEPIPLNNARH